MLRLSPRPVLKESQRENHGFEIERDLMILNELAAAESLDNFSY
jgi:hypothetical protein